MWVGPQRSCRVPLTFLPPGERKCVWFKLPLERTKTQREKCLPTTTQPCLLYLEATCRPASPRPLRLGHFITFSTQQVDSSHLTPTWSPSPVKF